jgi:hypothetical protein
MSYKRSRPSRKLNIRYNHIVHPSGAKGSQYWACALGCLEAAVKDKEHLLKLL